MTRMSLLAWMTGLLLPLMGRPGEQKPVKVLFLGDNGHHRPAERFRQLMPVLAKRGIDLTYTDKVADLNGQIADLHSVPGQRRNPKDQAR